MKKIFIFIIVVLALGCAYYFGKDYIPIIKNNYLEELGYSKEAIKKIEKLELENYLNETYYKVIDEALKQDVYKNEYFESYKLINYKDSDDFISIVNKLLDNNYNSDTINEISNIILSKYFKIDYLERYIKYKEKHADFNDEQIVMYVNIGLDSDFYTNIKEISNPDDLLVLVNKYNKLPENYYPTDIVEFDTDYIIYGGKREMRKVAHDAVVKLIDDMREKGMKMWINSTLRTESYQNKLFTNSVNRNGMEHALAYSAKPRHSEHETGLAVDMSSVQGMLDGFEKYEEYDWLLENAYKYGFIERYPKGKENITGYGYEPWHYRYVGIEAATIIKNENITYEEYAVKYLKY